MYQVWENNPYISGIYIKYSRLYVHIYIYYTISKQGTKPIVLVYISLLVSEIIPYSVPDQVYTGTVYRIGSQSDFAPFVRDWDGKELLGDAGPGIRSGQ